ncbi:sulfate ABC transporter substrate-binding protein [Patulibacter sp.]|uniref:sulfate ABC transporter substrate-binding protein n=1 Tax=Patulibacter sp. TaxID=1912859 RepID=UPI002725F4C4|nr:sulfate ABC transporter substrate-binding protein [Patulibacter sp.]MDO9410407.1 sulfate ABC transporter substrate-binding protein [Patulibacter sp.]
MRLTTRLPVFAALAASAVLAGCGGASDEVGGGESSSSSSGAQTKLSLVAYAVPKVGFDKIIPAFQKTEAGKGVTFSQSYGASGDQSRAVEAGQPADLVNFSLTPDVTRLVDSGKVAEDWNTSNAEKGIVSSSVVTIVVRKGNPKGIKDWSDLVKPGVEVVTPNVFSSGSAKWNLLAPYAQYSNVGKDKAAGLKFVGELLKNIKTQPKSGREATQTFLQGKADALLSYENEALNIEKNQPEAGIEHVTPPNTIRIENPFAVLKTSKFPEQAKAFADFNFSAEGQKLWGEAGFRPVLPDVAKEFADRYPAPKTLYTVEQLGGWSKLNDTLFDPDKGDIAKLYEDAGASTGD